MLTILVKAGYKKVTTVSTVLASQTWYIC